MTAKVRLNIFQGVEATIDHYKWTSNNKKIAQLLNSFLPDEPEPSDPNPDYTAAKETVKKLGGKVLSYDKPKFDPKVVY